VMKRAPLGVEIAAVAIVALALLVPGIWSYSLVDPWETHYGEVAREMRESHDFVHTTWRGSGTSANDNEGFRSKPVLLMWSTAAAMTVLGVAKDGGYSGEMVASARTMLAIRLPSVLYATLGLVLVWLMLAKLVSRRVAWLALLVVGSTPMFCLIARQGIPDMPHCACVMAALAAFVLALEDGDRPIAIAIRTPELAIDHRHLVLAACGVFVGVQAIYYGVYFARLPVAAVALPLLMALLYGALWPRGFTVLRCVPMLVGVIAAAIARRPIAEWDRYAPDRLAIRALAFPIAWARGAGWAETATVAEHLLRVAPLATMRQVYLLWCYAFLGLAVLAKGPPGVAVVGAVGVCHVLLFWRWRDLYEGAFELKRGLALAIAIFLPWHLAMWLIEGPRFIQEYIGTHIIERASADPDKSLGTFEFYTSQLGHGMWLWAALLPAALVAVVLRTRIDTRAGRVRFIVMLWAICGFAVFGIVQTKFHHYILPVVPALGILVAFFLDDLLALRERLHPLYAALAIGIVLLVARDLMWEPKRWMEMFSFLYNRPWPSNEPWSIDPSNGFLGLAAIAAIAIALAAVWRRAGVIALVVAGLAIGLWAMHVYMPIAGTHWGMREAMRSYYEQRTIYGEKRIYFGCGELYDDLHTLGDTFELETFIPDTLQVGQPMTLTIQLDRVKDEVVDQQLALVGTATAIGGHRVTVTLAPGERARLDPLLATCARAPEPRYGRPPVRYVDADRLVSWSLYWRGENFWSGDEIFGPAPELHTGFDNTADNTEFTKYLSDRTRAPLGRKYFVVTDAGHAQTLRSLLPTQRARDTVQVIDTTSNKFSMSSFVM
jgi:4-amino-4-deoxy-L-arabinose transferase-like glycosyltransferase